MGIFTSFFARAEQKAKRYLGVTDKTKIHVIETPRMFFPLLQKSAGYYKSGLCVNSFPRISQVEIKIEEIVIVDRGARTFVKLGYNREADILVMPPEQRRVIEFIP